MDHVWTVLCSHTIVDQTTNNISLMGVVESIQASGAPTGDARAAVPFNGEIVTLWSRSDPHKGERRRYRVKCESPNEILLDTVADVDLIEHVRRRMRAKIDILPVPEPGPYYFRIYLRTEADDDWDEVAKIPLEVHLNVQE